MALVWLPLARLGCFSLTRIRSCALSDHSVERIEEDAPWAAVEVADAVEVARHFEIAFHKPHLPMAIQLVPDRDRFLWNFFLA
jgi:hypothetical protein